MSKPSRIRRVFIAARKLALAVLTAVALILLVAIGGCLLFLPWSEGRFDRSQMENLVRQVRLQNFRGEKTFYWQEIAGTATLFPNRKPEMVWADCDQQGQLKVVILTKGGGHAGAWGFAYSDAPFTLVRGSNLAPEGGCELDLPGPLRAAYPKKKIDAHWWPVFDDLD